MTMDIYERIGVPSVINAAGKLTALGGSAQHEEVAAAQFSAARGHVDLSTRRRPARRRPASRPVPRPASSSASRR
jgi:seryl-tRNA(Sec) selenium transferase